MGFFSEIIASEARRDMAQSPVSTRQTAAVPPPVAAGSETNSPPTVAMETPSAPTVTTPTLDLSADADAADEAERKRAHEEAEAKRKAEWDAKQAAKKAARQEQFERINAMSDAELLAASVERVASDTERLTRRNMKEAVAEHIQTKCRKDSAFARLVMVPDKSMINCFQYINRMARDYVEHEMKELDIPRTGTYGCDVPDGLCYQWSEDYFNDQNAKEDIVSYPSCAVIHIPSLTICAIFHSIVASIGRPELRFHDLRHSYSVAAIRAGDDIKTVQGNLGHATAAFTLDVYGHVTDSMKQASANRMQKVIESIKGNMNE